VVEWRGGRFAVSRVRRREMGDGAEWLWSYTIETKTKMVILHET